MRIMNKRDETRDFLGKAAAVLTWPRACFDAEARADSRERPRLPHVRHSLKAGDRVSFDVGDGVDGPLYATNVRMIEPE
jgi:hypothetical protein